MYITEEDLKRLLPELNTNFIEILNLNDIGEFTLFIWYLQEDLFGEYLSKTKDIRCNYKYVDLLNNSEIIVQDIKETIYNRYCELLDKYFNNPFDEDYVVLQSLQPEQYLDTILTRSGCSDFFNYQMGISFEKYPIIIRFKWKFGLVPIDYFSISYSIADLKNYQTEGLHSAASQYFIGRLHYELVTHVKNQLKEKLNIIDD